MPSGKVTDHLAAAVQIPASIKVVTASGRGRVVLIFDFCWGGGGAVDIFQQSANKKMILPSPHVFGGPSLHFLGEKD